MLVHPSQWDVCSATIWLESSCQPVGPHQTTHLVRSIGRAICHKFVGEGYRVAVADVDHEAGRKVARELGDDALFVACNVRCGSCAQLAIGVGLLVKHSVSVTF